MDPSHMRLSPTFTASSNANPTSYPEMIRTAIISLGETEGSSKKAISNFIEQNYPNVITSAHSYLLPLHLDILQNHGLLHVHNKCYKLPACDDHHSPPRKRGRPPKIRPHNEATGGRGRPRKNDAVNSVTLFAGTGASDTGPAVIPYNVVPLEESSRRKRGRPKKNASSLPKKDPPKNETNINVMPLSANTSTSTSAIVKRGRGRPRKNASSQAVGQPNKVAPFARTGAGNTDPAVCLDDSLPVEESPRRKRGRPMKNASSLLKKEISVEDDLRSNIECPLPARDHSSSPTLQRKRGRPPKVRPEDEPTRGPGRPPKAIANIVDPPKNETNISVIPLSANTTTSTLPIVKRGRGRPRKNDALLTVGQPNKAIPFTGTGAANSGPTIRKRGRPKKNAFSLP